ncbi:MAG: hypothetical protein ACXW3H_01710 [Candidatus Aminicenantales bacterium]
MARPGLRSLSKARIITVMLLAGLTGLPAVPDQDQGQDVKTLIEDIKKTDRGRELLKSHSETDLEKMILFSRDPKKYFPDIQDIKDWCFYLAFYDDYMRLDLKSSYSLWFSWAGEKFTKADDDTAAILGFLLLNGRACGHLGEELADIYTALFRENPIPFMKDLEKRADWRPLVDSLSSGNWGEFRAGVAKLGDSMFEKEFRGYLTFEGSPEIPDELIQSAYTESAVKNVLAAVNPKVFPGYWSVCADGQGFGYGYTYPSLDGHQMTDALLWLGQIDVVKANWAHVRSFQRADGSLPIAILPDLAGKQAGEGEHLARVAGNGGLYTHWVPGNPLQALADPTFIQNADEIFRMTLDRNWLEAELPAVNLSAEHLASLVTDEGRVKGAGYYIEMPARVESDGVAQCHAIDAFRRVAALDRVAGDHATAKRFEALAERVRSFLVNRFWVAEKGQFAEYWHPEKGFISSHGLTDTDWAAIALDVATPEQTAVLWPKLANEPRFHYGGMPTGIATLPATYEDWEFTHPRRHDLAAMGRVWYLEAQARARMGDPQGLLDGLLKVAEVGRANGFFWRERYQPDGKGGVLAAGPNTYCEYPANLIRIVQRFLLGIDLNLDGSVTLAPSAIQGWWQKGFGQTLRWRSRSLQYEMKADRVFGTYQGDGPQTLRVRLPGLVATDKIRAEVRDLPAEAKVEDGVIIIHLARSLGQIPCRFEIVRKAGR